MPSNLNINTLADFKRFAAMPGVSLERLATPGFSVAQPRKIIKSNSRYFVFENEARLSFPKAADFKIEGDAVMLRNLQYRIIRAAYPELRETV